MRLIICNISIFLASLLLATAALAFDHTHSEWTSVLEKYVSSKGLVNYKLIKHDLAGDVAHPLKSYLSNLQKVSYPDFQKWDQPKKMAFLINAYNAFTVKLIVNHYPVKSIKKIGGFLTNPWKIEFFSLLDGKIKSIDPIEHEWLRPKFKDYRIHAAVNCASISCPLLRKEAYVAKKLSAQLDEQMRLWLNDRTRNELDSKSNVFQISKIFDWYEDDFVDWGGGVVQVINKYTGNKPLNRELASKIKLKYLNYNWDLNEQK